MNHEWRVGELAVCVIPLEGYLTKDWIYPVSEVTADRASIVDLDHRLASGGQLLRFDNVGRHPYGSSRGKQWWKSTRFRPLDESDYRRIADKHSEPEFRPSSLVAKLIKTKLGLD